MQGYPLSGRLAFAGSSHGYISTRVNLTSLAGKTVIFRWRMGLDFAFAVWGWWVDDVQVYSCPTAPSIPLLLSPVTGSLLNNSTPVLRWSPSAPLPDHYQLQIDTDDTFASPLYDVNLTTSEYTIPSPLGINTAYYWRVRAYNSTDVTAGWSPVGTFRLPPPSTTLVAPVMDAPLSTLRPLFDWADVSGAGYYTIQVSKNQAFTQMVLNESTSTSTFTPLQDLPPAATLYWRVRVDGANGPSPWSDVRSFTTPNPPGVPTLISPNSGLLLSAVPKLRWSPVSLPRGTVFDHYQVQLASNAGFTTTIVDSNVMELTNTSYSLPALSAGATYYWRVRAVNQNGEASSWSEVRTFNLRPELESDRPTISNAGTGSVSPSIVAPADGSAVGKRPVLDWGHVAGAVGYLVQVSTDPNFTSANYVVFATTVDSRYAFIRDIPAGSQLYWRVRAIGEDSISPWSVVSTFTNQ